MESRIKISTLGKRSANLMSNRIHFTGQHRKGNMIHILTFTGIEGREVILIELCYLKLFKGTQSLFDILG